MRDRRVKAAVKINSVARQTHIYKHTLVWMVTHLDEGIAAQRLYAIINVCIYVCGMCMCIKKNAIL